jgi:hypothetical protein
MFLSIGLSTALLPGKSRIDCPLYQDNKVTTSSATARRCGRLGRVSFHQVEDLHLSSRRTLHP